MKTTENSSTSKDSDVKMTDAEVDNLSDRRDSKTLHVIEKDINLLLSCLAKI